MSLSDKYIYILVNDEVQICKCAVVYTVNHDDGVQYVLSPIDTPYLGEMTVWNTQVFNTRVDAYEAGERRLQTRRRIEKRRFQEVLKKSQTL